MTTNTLISLYDKDGKYLEDTLIEEDIIAAGTRYFVHLGKTYELHNSHTFLSEENAFLFDGYDVDEE